MSSWKEVVKLASEIRESEIENVEVDLLIRLIEDINAFREGHVLEFECPKCGEKSEMDFFEF